MLVSLTRMDFSSLFMNSIDRDFEGGAFPHPYAANLGIFEDRGCPAASEF